MPLQPAPDTKPRVRIWKGRYPGENAAATWLLTVIFGPFIVMVLISVILSLAGACSMIAS
jgi:hypothetical protein